MTKHGKRVLDLEAGLGFTPSLPPRDEERISVTWWLLARLRAFMPSMVSGSVNIFSCIDRTLSSGCLIINFGIIVLRETEYMYMCPDLQGTPQKP